MMAVRCALNILVLYQVINWGNNQEQMFKNDRDKVKFLEFLDIAAKIFDRM